MSDTDRPDQGMLERVGGLGRDAQRGRGRRDWLLLGKRKDPTPGCIDLYEPPGDHVGISCSGGGIRSAAFNLGALQVLQQYGVLQRAKYLSAVSGGSYIAAAFCMVAKRWAGAEPNGTDSDPALVNHEALPFHPGSPEEQYLRNHLGYLAPDGTAKLYLVLRMLAGMSVNVLLIGLPALILGLLVGQWVVADYGNVLDGRLEIPAGVWWPVVGLTGLALALAVLDVIWRPKKDDLQAMTQTWQVRFFLLAAAAALLLIAVPWLAVRAIASDDLSVSEAALGSAGTALSSMAALAVAAIAHVRGHVKDQQQVVAGVTSRLGRFAKRFRTAAVAVIVMLAGPLLLVAICVLGVLISVFDAAEGVWWLIGASLLLAVMWASVDLTTVSLHPFYRRRLATAFALRRIWPEDGDGKERPAPPPEQRNGNRGVARQRPFDAIVELSESRVEPGPEFDEWPLLIVCAAANVSDPGATPPGRAVASFTFSPTAIGGPLTGAAETDKYENLGRNRRRDITLPAAVAMSGAALSPSMGKMTYRPLTFLLALANIRLGVWVPNPRHVNDTCDDGGTSLAPKGGRDQVSLRHRPRPQYLWKELFGRNRIEDKFLYVTDGGHYENLGLVELVRRGCGTIYCFDAGGGETSKALGDAIALARTELNVEIEMETTAAELAASDGTGLSRRVFAKGTIHYPTINDREAYDGTLIYVRSVLAENSAWDLRLYRDEDMIFPNHSTLDQFFDDQKFEAYRRLGKCAATAALQPDPMVPATVTQLARIEEAGEPQN
jgi:hypothetical protein